MKHVSDFSKPWQNTGNRALFDTQPQQNAYATMANPDPVMAKSRPSMMAMRVITNTHPTRTRPCPSPTKTGAVLPKPTKRANQPTNPPLQSKNSEQLNHLQRLICLALCKCLSCSLIFDGTGWLVGWKPNQPSNTPTNQSTIQPAIQPTTQAMPFKVN